MNSLKANRCLALMHLYLQNKDDHVLRNKIFDLSCPTIVKYLKSSTRRSLTSTELISMSWDVFMNMLSRFPAKNYMQILSKSVHYVINKETACIKKKNGNEKNIGNAEYPEPSVQDTADLRDALIMLKDFRDSLPPNYKIVLDDCLASFGEDTRSKQSRTKLAELPTHRYYEAKKVMSWALEHILGRKR